MSWQGEVKEEETKIPELTACLNNGSENKIRKTHISETMIVLDSEQ